MIDPMNAFSIIGSLKRETIGHQWIPLTKANNVGSDVCIDASLNK